MTAVVLKLSGEVLGGEAGVGLDPPSLQRIGEEIAQGLQPAARVGIVVGGGNFIRGRSLTAFGIPRERADVLGMLGTVVNGLALQCVLEKRGVHSEVLSALPIRGVVRAYREDLLPGPEGGVVIFVGGTGHPYLSTDTTAALRACQVGARLILKATKVDGVYSSDPVGDPQARFFRSLRYDQVLEENLQVMDLTAITLCKENRIGVRVFNVTVPGNLARVLRGEEVGSIIGETSSA